jgi:hypothetical protein
MAVETRKLTYEEYLAMPEMRCRYEIIDGEMIMAPSPIPIHRWVDDSHVNRCPWPLPVPSGSPAARS